jgi:hypothetical protein
VSSLKPRLLLYLYGAPHIVGSSLALLGLGLYFAGVINSFWYLIVAGLYVAGVFLVPAGREHSLKLHREAKVSEIRKTLEHLLLSLRGKVVNAVYERVQSIVVSIQQVLPRLEQADASDHDAYTIREMALTYLPETLENYLKLPRAYARFHPVRDGKTSKELLLEQLAVLDAEMQQVVEDVNRDKVNTLQAHGRFLRNRFGHSDRFIV